MPAQPPATNPKPPGRGWFEYKGKDRFNRDRWLYAVDGIREPGTHRRRIHKKMICGTVRQVEIQARDFLHDIEHRVYIRPTSQTVGEYLENWLESHIVRASVKRGYKSIVRRHLIPALGHVRLKDLAHDDIKTYYKNAQQFGRVKNDGNGPGLSRRSIKNIHCCLHRALSTAVAKKLIPSNPANPIEENERMYEKPARSIPSTYDPSTLNTFIAAAKEHELWPELATSIFTGMRRGEVCGLQWRDINFAAKTVSVCRTLQIEGGTIFIEPPKTDNGYRTIPMAETLYDTLKAHQQQRIELLDLLDEHLKPTDWVFCRYDFSPRRPNHLSKVFVRLTRQIGRPDVTLHGLRHTFASILIAQGESVKLVQELLGHYDPGFTLRTYTHVPTDSKNQATNKFDETLREAD